MFKKGGLIVGITIILIALGIYWFTGHLKGSKEGVAETPTETSLNGAITQEVNQPQQVIQEPNQTSTQPIKENQTYETDSPYYSNNQQSTSGNSVQSKVFSEIDEQSLGEPADIRTEIMIVSRKKVLLLDSNKGTNEGKQLAYSVELLANDKPITLFLNGVVYDSLFVGDKIQVDYEVYKNDNGVEFPIILNAKVVE